MRRYPKVFLETPIATLEDYGITARQINMIHRMFGLYIKDLLYVDKDKMISIPGVAEKTVDEIIHAMRTYLEECGGSWQ